MIEIKSRLNNDLLHLVGYSEYFSEPTRRELVAPSEFIQCAALVMNEGRTFKPHQHIHKPAVKDTVIAQESWVIMRGSVFVSYYDTDGLLLDVRTLREGDISITLKGGHNYKILEDDTMVYEFKTGPYEGQSKDKVFI